MLNLFPRLFSHLNAQYPNNPCMQKRHFIRWKSPKVKEFGPDVTTYTYKEVGEKCYKFGAALRAAGCVPSPPTTDLEKVKTPCRMAIFENTCAEWLMSAVGASTQSVTVVTVYATLGLDAVVEAINDNIIPVIVCNKSNVKNLVDKKKMMPTLKAIVYTNDLVGSDSNFEIPAAPKGLSIMSFDDFVASGDTASYPPTPPTADSTSTVMYTSGSTGKPKGVVITHRSVVAGVAAADILLNMSSDEKYLAYLPAAHIMEFMIEFCIMRVGSTLCYADPKSLTQTGSYPVGALEVYKPTRMVAVPKIWDTIKKGLLAKVAKSSPVAQALVHTALEWRAFATSIGLDTPLFNAIVFKKFKAAVGGNIRWALSGGGPLNGEVQDFIRTAFGFPLVQGYVSIYIHICNLFCFSDKVCKSEFALILLLFSCLIFSPRFGCELNVALLKKLCYVIAGSHRNLCRTIYSSFRRLEKCSSRSSYSYLRG